jgi:competence protein ComEC
VGLLTNLIFVPLIGFVVVPLSLCAVFIYPLSLHAAVFLIKAGGFILAKTLIILHFISELQFVALKTVSPSLFEITCFYTGLAAVFNLNSPLALRRKQAKVVALVVVILLVADIFFWLEKRAWHDDLRVTVIDVGEGSSALLELPGGQCMLIDGGGFSDNRVFDVGKSIIAPFLWRKKIRTVDTLVLSHPNSDHLNGLIYIAKNFNVKNVWSNNESVNTFAYKKFMDVLEGKDIDMPNFKVMPRSFNISGVIITVCYPPPDFIDKKKMETWRNTNNNSVVLKAEFGAQSFLFPGDIMAKGEKELVSLAGSILKSTVLIAPHHGSKTSSTQRLLDSVQPKTVVISAGWKSRFGFPHKSVLKKYSQRGCEVFRTDIQGAIMMQTDGDVLNIRTTID